MLKKLIACAVAAMCMVGTAYNRPLNASCIEFENEGDLTYFIQDGAAEIFSLSRDYSGELVIPDSLGGYPVTRIGKTAFSECNGLTSVTLPNTLEFIGEYAFNSCTSLKTLTIPEMKSDDVQLSDYAFFGCTALEEVKFPKRGFRTVSQACFYRCHALKTVELSEFVSKIDYYAFFDCSSLENLIIRNPHCDIPLDPATVCTTYSPDGYWYSGVISGLPNSTAEYYAYWCGVACLSERKFEELTDVKFLMGDADFNWYVNAADASAVLAEYARLSTGNKATFSDRQKIQADVDQNGSINAADASMILAFYAYRSTGGHVDDLDLWRTLFVEGHWKPM